MDVNLLWIQKLKDVLVKAIKGTENLADLGTKALSRDKIAKYLRILGYRGDYVVEQDEEPTSKARKVRTMQTVSVGMIAKSIGLLIAEGIEVAEGTKIAARVLTLVLMCGYPKPSTLYSELSVCKQVQLHACCEQSCWKPACEWHDQDMSTQFVLAQAALKCENKRGSGAPESATATALLAESMPSRLLVLTLLATITKLIGANTAKSQPGKRIQFWNLSFRQEAERKEVKVWEKIQKKNYDQKENHCQKEDYYQKEHYYQKEDYFQKEGNHLYTMEDMTLKDGNYQFQYTVEYKTQRASCYNLQRPEEPLPELPEEISELDLQLEEYLPGVPQPPYLLPGEEEGSGDLPQLHDRDLLELQDGKEEEESGRGERERGRKRKRSKERRKRDKEERKRRKERKREGKAKRGPRKLLAILDKVRIRPTRRPRPKVQIQPRIRQKEGMAKVQAKGQAKPEPKPRPRPSTKARASPEPKAKPRAEMDLRIPITPPAVRPGESLEQQRRNFELYQQAETNRLRKLSMYVAALAKTAAKLPQPEKGVKKDTKEAPKEAPPEERHDPRLEEKMEKDKRDLGDLRVYRRRRQGKYAQESEEREEPEPPMGDPGNLQECTSNFRL